tara:strand:+ start:138 stop:446 length:309 start_codon:yes stop_codon:yes gene_type:complete
MKLFTFAKTNQGIKTQFERETKNKDESWYWDKLDTGVKYEFLLKYYYGSKFPTNKSQLDEFYKDDFEDLPEDIQDIIINDWELFLALWIMWHNQENMKKLKL